MNWKGKHVLVTGGTSFIGSSLVDALVSRGAIVRVVDDLSTGRYEYISRLVGGSVESSGRLLDAEIATRSVRGIEYLFHLGYPRRPWLRRPAQCRVFDESHLDGQLFREAVKAQSKRSFSRLPDVFTQIIFRVTLKGALFNGRLVGPPYDADNMYGWASSGGADPAALRQTRSAQGGIVSLLYRLRAAGKRKTTPSSL